MTSSSSNCIDEEFRLQSLGLPPAEVLDFVENGAMSLHWVGPDGTILWANRDELNTLGYEAEEYIGKHIAEFHDDQDVLNDIIRRLQAGEILRDVPARMIHKEGTIIHVEINSSAYMDDNQHLSHTRCFTRNVTARKLAESEREKQAAEENAKAAQESAELLEHLSERLRQEVHLQQCLLHQMLPPRVAEDLRAGRRVPPEAFDHVTIFFSDIEGFTKIAGAVEPIDIVHLLNILYIAMDCCASLFPIYKVETIGDAYMVVGGLPEPALGDEHAAAVADFALLAQRVVRLVANPLQKGTSIRLRMGMHSGAVLAGVVGNLMPRYCLFGDTVNTASRMESTGEADRIHCSGRVAELLRRIGGYALEPRGQVEVKGKGIMETFWLSSGPEDCHPDGFLQHVQELIAEAPREQSYSLLMHEDADDCEVERKVSLRSELAVRSTASLRSRDYIGHKVESMASLPSVLEFEPTASSGTAGEEASTDHRQEELLRSLENANNLREELAAKDAKIQKLTVELRSLHAEGAPRSPSSSSVESLALSGDSLEHWRLGLSVGDLKANVSEDAATMKLTDQAAAAAPPSPEEAKDKHNLPGGGSLACLPQSPARVGEARSRAMTEQASSPRDVSKTGIAAALLAAAVALACAAWRRRIITADSRLL